MNGIFISYRREDGAAEAGRIADRLQLHFGEERVFQDVDNIPLGIDFREYIDQQLDQCRLFLVVIGDRWLDVLLERRQQPDTADYVFHEVLAALEKETLPVVPVLVGNASVPPAAALPEPIRALSYRNGMRVRSDNTFDAQVQKLIDEIEKHIGPAALAGQQFQAEPEAAEAKNTATVLRRGCSAHFGKFSIVIALCIAVFAVRGVLEQRSPFSLPDNGEDAPPAVTLPPDQNSGGESAEDPPPLAVDPQPSPGTETGAPGNRVSDRLAGVLDDPDGSLPFTVRLDALQFEHNESIVSGARARRQMLNLARILEEYPDVRIDVQGHIDPTERDVTLSTARAREVYEMLLRAGIDEERMTFRGQYDKEPLAPSDTENNRRLNRRVEIVLQKAR